MNKVLKQAIFDLDGCLLDTEDLRFRAWRQAIKERGMDFSKKDYNQLLGRSRTDVDRLLFEMFPFVDIQELREEYNSIHDEMLVKEGVDIKPGVTSLLEVLKTKGVKTVLATSSHKELASMSFEYAGFQHQFDYCIYGDQVHHAKPDPEIYLKAKNLYGFDESNMLVFEDSYNGIVAANRAGIDVVYIPDMGTFSTDEVQVFREVPKISDVLKYIEFNS